ncbi:MAG: amidohydrolase family protein [Candidatus Aminicenantes bacterium]|nr:MAG: amidohydrolase family protein [Candidatus Aminicenantes bacterium]
MRSHKCSVPLLSLLLVFAGIYLFAGGAEDAYLIKGAKIYTSGTQGVLTDAALLIENGLFKKIIDGEEWPSVPVKDYSGKTIMPGMVDAHSYVSGYYGLLDNTKIFTSDLITDMVFDPLDPEVKLALESGITTVNLSPRNENLVGGISSILKLSRDFNNISVLKKRSFLKISFNGEVIRPDRAPTSLMGAEHLLTQKMAAIKPGSDQDRADIFPQKGLRSLLGGNLPPMIAASTLAEVNTTLQWLEKWQLNGVIVGGEEAHLLIPSLKQKNVPVLMSPILPSYPEKWAKNAAHLIEHGILLAFVSHMPETDPWSLRLSALMLYHQGISQQEALKTITLTPAQILGVADSVGSIEEGKHADFVVLEGEPLDLGSPIVAVYVNGRAALLGEK